MKREVPDEKVQQERKQGDPEHEGHEYRAGTVGRALDGRLVLLCSFDQINHLANERSGSNGIHFELCIPVQDQRAPEQAFAGLFFQGKAFPREQRLVHGHYPRADRAVGGYFVAFIDL